MFELRGLSWPLVASIAAAVLLASPLWFVTAPGMPDYPAHLASFALIGGAPSAFYSVTWQALPNLAFETLAPLLAHLTSLQWATRLLLSMTVVLWVLGPAAIQHALFGRVSASVLFAAFFAYNANFMWGFFNYTFATGLAFFVFAAWIASDTRRGTAHLAAFAATLTLLYFGHLFALAVLLLAIGCYEMSGWYAETPREARKLVARLWPLAAICLPAAFAFLVLKPAGAAGGNLEFDLADTMLDRAGAAVQLGFDRPDYLLTAGLCLSFAIGVYLKLFTVHPRMRLLLIVFTLCTLLAPEWALGGWGVHMRLPAVLGVLAFASVEWHASRRVQILGGAALFVLMAGGALAVAQDWRRYDAQFAEFRANAADIKPKGRLLTVLDGDSLGWGADQPYWHMAEFAVIDRGVFTPLMFTTAGQHVVHIRPPLERIAAAAAQQGSPPDIDELDDLAAGRSDADEDIRDIFPYLLHFDCHFDQAVVIHGAGRHARVPAMLRQVREASFYTLYDIVPGKGCAAR